MGAQKGGEELWSLGFLGFLGWRKGGLEILKILKI